MKKILSLFFISIILFSCSSESLDDAPKYNETIVGRWHLDGFEKNTMYIFDSEKRYTIYSDDGTFGGIEDAIPNPNSYTFENNNLLIDLNFGNTFDAMIEFECENSVVNVIRTFNNETSTWIWWREGESKDCL